MPVIGYILLLLAGYLIAVSLEALAGKLIDYFRSRQKQRKPGCFGGQGHAPTEANGRHIVLTPKQPPSDTFGKGAPCG